MIAITMAAVAIRFTLRHIGKNIASNIYISQGPNPRKQVFRRLFRAANCLYLEKAESNKKLFI
jgi:hypothetical protein